jgi:hypothetical protein
MAILLYCPMLYHHDKGMWPPVISSTSYFLWQKNLWSVFQQLEGWEVLWNAGQPNSNLYDPIQEWNSTNIQYSKMNMKKALKKCDRVFVDFPSTAMWDAKKANKPCLCITLDNHWIRPDVKLEFKENIQIVSFYEIGDVLSDWLNKEVSDHFVKFAETKNDWIEKIAI